MQNTPDTEYLRYYLDVAHNLVSENIPDDNNRVSYENVLNYIKDEIRVLESKYGHNVPSNLGRRNYRALEFMLIGILASLHRTPVWLDRTLMDIERTLYYQWSVQKIKNDKQKN